MPAVFAVMLLVVCEPDLVHCSPVETWERGWKTVASCRLDKARIVRQVRARVGEKKTVMSKCRLYLDEGGRFRRSMLAKTPETPDLLVF